VFVAVVGTVSALLKAVRDLVDQDANQRSEEEVADTTADMNRVSGSYGHGIDSVGERVFGNPDGGEIRFEELL
jgi:hypothetical protein